MTAFTPAMSCPYCGAALDAHSGHARKGPKAQDAAICWRCRSLAVYTMSPAGLMLRRPTREEIAEVAFREDFKDLLVAIDEGADPIEAERLFQERIRRRADPHDD